MHGDVPFFGSFHANKNTCLLQGGMCYAICSLHEEESMSEIKVDPRVYHGSPDDLAERREEERETFLFLDRLGVPYDRVEHEPAMTI